jgi:hypothetical protein
MVCDLKVYVEFKEYEKQTKFKIYKVIKSTSKTRVSHVLLSTAFKEKRRKSHLGILLSSEHIIHNKKKNHEKKIQLKQQYWIRYYFQAFKQNIKGVVY